MMPKIESYNKVPTRSQKIFRMSQGIGRLILPAGSLIAIRRSNENFYKKSSTYDPLDARRGGGYNLALLFEGIIKVGGLALLV